MQLFCRLVPPSVSTAHTKSRGCRHDKPVTTLGVRDCDPHPPLKNPSYAPVLQI